MTILALVIALVLFCLAALHAYWGIGGVWPGTDGASCARTIVGFKGITKMPSPPASFAVAAALLLVSLLSLSLGGVVSPPVPAALIVLAGAGAGAAAVFLGRGIAGYVPAWRRMTPEQPFARLDVRYYSPLCLAVGAGMSALTLQVLLT